MHAYTHTHTTASNLAKSSATTTYIYTCMHTHILVSQHQISQAQVLQRHLRTLLARGMLRDRQVLFAVEDQCATRIQVRVCVRVRVCACV
jgi:hypothetical protein